MRCHPNARNGSGSREDRPLRERDPQTLTDAEAISRLVEVEAGIAAFHALRADLVALVAAQRPAAADRPVGQPGAGSRNTAAAAGADGADADGADEGVPEVLDVSEWLPHELQMAHPYSWTAVQDLVATSLVLTGRLSATLSLLRPGGSTTSGPGSSPTNSAAAAPRSRTPWKLWCCQRRPG